MSTLQARLNYSIQNDRLVLHIYEVTWTKYPEVFRFTSHAAALEVSKLEYDDEVGKVTELSVITQGSMSEEGLS